MLGDGIEFYRTADHRQAVFYDDTLSRGRVEVCHRGEFRAVCADSGHMWDNRDAMVICRELGLSPYGEPPTVLLTTYLCLHHYKFYGVIFAYVRVLYSLRYVIITLFLVGIFV